MGWGEAKTGGVEVVLLCGCKVPVGDGWMGDRLVGCPVRGHTPSVVSMRAVTTFEVVGVRKPPPSAEI